MLPKHNKTDGFERPVLCDEKIFQFGDAIAIVAADTEEHARAAADVVKVEIEELPAYMNAMDAIAPDAAEIHPGTPNAFLRQTVSRDRTLTGTAFRIHSRLRSSPTVHASLIFTLSRTVAMDILMKTV